MNDTEYFEFKDKKEKWFLYQEKLPNEIRLLTADIALLESANNDNTSIWIIRLIPDGGRYRKILAYGESLHGINSIIQTKRIKQLFYELECDYAVIDTQGVGRTLALLFRNKWVIKMVEKSGRLRCQSERKFVFKSINTHNA